MKFEIEFQADGLDIEALSVRNYFLGIASAGSYSGTQAKIPRKSPLRFWGALVLGIIDAREAFKR